MTIRDMDKFVSSLPDWAILDGCFGNTRIRPTDVDGMVERKGRCLFLEHKGRDASLTDGQAIAFVTLAKQGNTVITYWAEGMDVSKIRVDDLRYSGGLHMYESPEATLEKLRSLVSRWFAAADAS